MLLGILLVSLMGLTWVVSGIVMGRAPKENVIIECFIPLNAGCSMLLGLVLGAFSEIPPLNGASLTILGCTFLCGVCSSFQLYSMSKAMQSGPNGIVWSVAQSGCIAPFLMGVICFHTPASPLRWLGFAAVAFSVMMIGGMKTDYGKKYGKWKKMALLSFLMTGLLQSFNNLPSYLSAVESVSSVWRTTSYNFGICCAAVAFQTLMGRNREYIHNFRETLKQKKAWQFCALMIGFSLFGSCFLSYPGMDMLAKANAGAIAFPLMVGSCLIGFEVYSCAFLHETRSRMQWLMLGLCLCGVILLIF